MKITMTDLSKIKPLIDPDRFWSKVEENENFFGECWNWTDVPDGRGYGGFHSNGKLLKAHKVAYELLKGPIPKGKELDHLCRNTRCVNPDHLEPVTHRENLLRGVGIASINAKKTHCPKGHLLAGENLDKYELNRGHRKCRTCKNLALRRWWIRHTQTISEN